MKIKYIKWISLLLMGVTIVSSCDLEVIPPKDFSAKSFWKNEKSAWYGLNTLYAQIPGFNVYGDMKSDNAHSHKPWEGPFELLQKNGISAENDLGYNFYTIRLVNKYLEDIQRCTMDESLKERMKAEARFFRAMSYLELTNLFGKVPLITKVLSYDAKNVERDEVSKVHSFILDELTEIATLLPKTYKGGYLYETSRITRGAALALKSRAALYFGQFDVAEKSAKAVIDEGVYALFKVAQLNAAQQKEANEMEQYVDFNALGIDKDKFMKGVFSYESIWHNEHANPKNPEYILTREFMGTDQNYDWTRYIYIRPSQLKTGYASFEPIQDLVSAYWDIDGKTLRPEIDIQEKAQRFKVMTDLVKDIQNQASFIERVPQLNMKDYAYMQEFRNRDARLYASILFPFKGWHETDCGTFYYRVNPKDIGINGNETWTGYAFRKLVSLNAYNDWASEEDYPTIRYAEVLLNYAEARIQTTGWDSEVRKALNELRDRCGMPDVPITMGTKQDALDFVRNERRIELAGEGQRFDDIRRYGEAYCAKVMNGPTYAPNGYLVVDKIWNDRLMLMPIPQSAIDSNPLLKEDQNLGYN